MSAWLWLVLACGDCARGPTDADWTEDQPLGPGGTAACGELANLELVPLDIWGRDLGAAALTLDRDPTWVEDPGAGPGVVMIRYGQVPVDLRVRLETAEHQELSVVVSYDGAGGFRLGDPSSGRVTTSFETRTLDGAACPVSTLYLGQDHTWFAATGRAPTDNRVTLAMDGEEQWQGVYDDLQQTSQRVTWTTWWWESDFELVRSAGDFDLSQDARWQNTAMGQLEALGGVERRILVNRFWDENLDWLEYLNTDEELRDVADRGGDQFEVMLQGNPVEVPVFGEYQGQPADFDFGERVLDNPRYADRDVRTDTPAPVPVALSVQVASYHQKSVVLDGQVAWVSGMNVKGADWDGNQHEVYDARRMEFDATADERRSVARGEAEPDFGPRKDYGLRLEGPAARDVEEILWQRWEAAIDGDDLYSENATRFALDPAAASPADAVPAQVIATMPPPWSEMSIQESHAKAIQAAEDYIYVEDQYFRAPLMIEHVIEAMDARPELVLIVVTKDVSAWDGGAKYTWLADATLRQRYPDRYLLLQLQSADLYLDEGTLWDTVEVVVQAVDTHSKLRLVDDRYLSVGSCNWNNRGYKYEGELDVAVLDDAVAVDARRRIFENLVGEEWADLLSDEGQNNLDVLALAAADNQEILDWWAEHGEDLDLDEAAAQWESYRPSGFVYPLQIDEDYQFDVGPDAF